MKATNYSWKILWFLVAVAVLVVPPISAQPPGAGEDAAFGLGEHGFGAQSPGGEGIRGQRMRRRGSRGPGRLIEFLELTEAQQEEWKAAHEAHRESAEPIMDQVRDNRTELHEAIESDNPNPTEIGELTLAGRDLRRELEASQEELRQALESVLTPEQLEKWEAFEAAGGGRRRHFGGRGRSFRGPRGGVDG